MNRVIFRALLTVSLFYLPVAAQVSGRLTGTALDQGGNAIVGAAVTLKNLPEGE
jgi:hypothetical protein